MELYSIETGNFKLDGGASFGVVPKTMWNKVYPADENNLINIPMRCLLIVDAEKKILIDCGMGEKMNPKLLEYYFINGDDTLTKSLAKVGVDPDEITDVILTHLHFDHCGGSVKTDGSLMFPNATHWVSRSHWETAHHPNRREKPSFFLENFDPIQKAGKLKIIQKESKVTKNVKLKLYYGHTEGLIIPYITYSGKTLVYAGDFISSSPHVQMSYICGYDVNPLITFEEKELFLAEAVKKNYILFFEHDLYTECCSVEQTNKGVRVKERFPLAVFTSN